MNWADYVILAVLTVSVLIGLWRGLVSEVLALVIWAAAFWVAWMFGPDVARYFEGRIDLPSARLIVGYALCFVAVLIGGALVRFLISQLIESTGLSGSDRVLGMGFGLARGLLLVTLAVFLLGFTPFTRDPWWHRSYLLPGFQGAAGWLAERLPDAVRRYVEPLKPMARDVPFPLSAARAAGQRFPINAASVRPVASSPDSTDPAHQP